MRLAGPGEVAEWTRHKFSSVWGDPDQDIIDGISERMRAGDLIPAVALVNNHEIVDGWHRVLAARQSGVGLHVEDLSENDDLVGRVLAGNMLRRRHSAVEATRLAILTLEAGGWKLYTHGRSELSATNEHLSDKYLKNEDIAKYCGVGISTITKARQIISAERDPGIAAARERRLESKRLEREEQELEYLEAQEAVERDRARESHKIEALEAQVATLQAKAEIHEEAEDLPDVPENVITTKVEKIVDPLVKRNQELLEELDVAWKENDKLKREVSSLTERLEHARKVIANWEKFAKDLHQS